jgi:two-component system, cell cycle sensor histidine kinase and response regulator CckA
MLRRLIGENIELVWNPGPELWPVQIDPSQLNQIVTNLVVNARDAIQGTGKIILNTANELFDEVINLHPVDLITGPYIMLEVADTGMGMSQEVKERIFEPYFTTKGLGRGTGLGLATVYGIVKQNNGMIVVYSEEGQGTVFKIYFPRFFGNEPLDTQTHKSNDSFRGEETILLVEDELALLNLAQKKLSELGYQVIAASSPLQALNKVKNIRDPIHLLITDIILPEMNGWELSEHLKALQPEMKCLYMSGYPINVVTAQGVLHKGIQMIEKPFSLKTLAEKIREVLQSS